MSHLTFLIAGDNSRIQNLPLALKEIEGMSVSSFETAENALCQISAGPDFIIMEIAEKLYDVECLAVFRQFLPKARIFVISSKNDIQFFEEALSNGADYYFLKNDIVSGDLIQMMKKNINDEIISPGQWFSEYLRRSNKKDKQRKIFHLDDNKNSTFVIQQLLSSQPNCTIKSFNNPIDFLHEYYINKPDIVILDYYLEEKVTGLDLLKIIKERPGTEVIILSRQGDVSIASDLMLHGADHYLMKSNKSLERLISLLQTEVS